LEAPLLILLLKYIAIYNLIIYTNDSVYKRRVRMSETPVPESEEMPEMEITQDDKLYTALCYVFSPLVPIIFYFLEDKKERPFIKEHLMQALISGVVLSILSLIPFVNCTVPILWLVNAYNGYRAFQGESFELPVITDFVRNQNW